MNWNKPKWHCNLYFRPAQLGPHCNIKLRNVHSAGELPGLYILLWLFHLYMLCVTIQFI